MNIQFADPWLLTLVLLLPFLALWHWWSRRRGGSPSLRYASVRLVAVSNRSWRLRLRLLLPFLRWLALMLMIVALARPQIVDAEQVIKGQGIDIALALDISGSMAGLDLEPHNRLGAARQVIKSFVAERPYDRIGLTVFASEAFSQCPPTTDHDVLTRLLDQVKLSWALGLEDGTAIGLGLANAANMLKDSTAKSKVVVLLTDGVNNAGLINPVTAAEAAASLGIKVYTVGVGRPGKVPIPRPTVLGEQVVMMDSVLDEESLQQIAEMTGGRYYRAEDTEGLQQIYAEINQLEKSELQIRTFNHYTEVAAWLLVPALLLLLGEATLRQTLLRTIP